MEAYQEKLIECCEAYRSTGSARMLMTYRSRTDRLSFDERMTVIRECQEAFAPFSLEMCKQVPGLSESDLLFCALSAMGFSNVIIAECLTITPDAVRMRKLRFREKVSPEVYATLFPTPEKHSSAGAKRNKSERDDKVTENNCTASDGTIPLQHVSINPLTSKEMKTNMTFGKAIKSCFKQYFSAKGRASRAEFFYYLLFVVLVSILTGGMTAIILFRKIVSSSLVGQPRMILATAGWIYFPVMLVVAIPLISVAQRRLHDIERNGAWAWLAIMPLLLIGVIGMILSSPGLMDIDKGGVTAATTATTIILTFNIINTWFTVAGIILLVRLTKKGTEGPNRYGPDPTVITSEEQTTPIPAESV